MTNNKEEIQKIAQRRERGNEWLPGDNLLNFFIELVSEIN